MAIRVILRAVPSIVTTSPRCLANHCCLGSMSATMSGVDVAASAVGRLPRPRRAGRRRPPRRRPRGAGRRRRCRTWRSPCRGRRASSADTTTPAADDEQRRRICRAMLPRRPGAGRHPRPPAGRSRRPVHRSPASGGQARGAAAAITSTICAGRGDDPHQIEVVAAGDDSLFGRERLRRRTPPGRRLSRACHPRRWEAPRRRRPHRPATAAASGSGAIFIRATSRSR